MILIGFRCYTHGKVVTKRSFRLPVSTATLMEFVGGLGTSECLVFI